MCREERKTALIDAMMVRLETRKGLSEQAEQEVHPD